MTTKKVVYFDMDDTICDYSGAFKERMDKSKYPQSKIGFFSNLKPIPEAFDSIKILSEYYEIWFLTRPSIKNRHCYSEKADWIYNHFGEEMLDRLMICPDKSKAIGDYLIDDDTRNGQLEFYGEFLHLGSEKFPNWESIVSYLKSQI